MPFTTQELFQNGKEALYYGINALSNNLIMVDRKLLKNPNGLILGTPGSGKSFSAKREIANCFLLTSDEVESWIRKRNMPRWWSVCMGRLSNFAHFHQLHQPHGPEPGLFG